MPTSNKQSGNEPGSDPGLLVNVFGKNIMTKDFLITDVEHDFDYGFADAVEIKIITTLGEFTIWCQTAGQTDGKLLVELGRAEKCRGYAVKSDQ